MCSKFKMFGVHAVSYITFMTSNRPIRNNTIPQFICYSVCKLRCRCRYWTKVSISILSDVTSP